MKAKNIYQRNQFIDRWSARFISFLGVGTILSTLAIIVVIFSEFLPLFKNSTFEEAITFDSVKMEKKVLLNGMGIYFENAYVLSSSGEITFYNLKSKKEPITEFLFKSNKEMGEIISASSYGSNSFVCYWKNGFVSRHEIKFTPVFELNKSRVISKKIEEKDRFKVNEKGFSKVVFGDDLEGKTVYAFLDTKGKVKLLKQTKEEDFLGNIEVSNKEFNVDIDDRITKMVMDKYGESIYCYGKKPYLYRIETQSGKVIERMNLKKTPTALCMMLGEVEIVLGYNEGTVQVYAPALSDGVKVLKKTHEMKLSTRGITKLLASPRNRTLFAIDSVGDIKACYTTNERILGTIQMDGVTEYIQTDIRGKGLICSLKNHQIKIFKIESAHPDVNVKALFGKVWYASYQAPDYTWQSSSGSDDFEAKFSLMPLIFGSFKASLYAMLFSIPISILAALYVSQFAATRVKKIVKPVIETMSAFPSVVIGFIAALVLAPYLDSHLLPLLLCIVLCPLMLFLILFFSSKQLSTKGNDLSSYFLSMAIFIIYITISFQMADPVNNIFFDGDFKIWLTSSVLGDNYDMRNSIIIAFALGFAVIPIVFSMSEDALSSVPKNLATASLALGASPWQTAWKIVLPAASPGIFAGIMLGFGRAIGETMIVLMATGNTPIIDPSIFNGLRSLSANIAVEIPEAPMEGTLYRILFLSAGILLVFTSVLNSVSEVVRHRLRKTYSKF